jgi:hypothetical protein
MNIEQVLEVRWVGTVVHSNSNKSKSLQKRRGTNDNGVSYYNNLLCENISRVLRKWQKE